MTRVQHQSQSVLRTAEVPPAKPLLCTRSAARTDPAGPTGRSGCRAAWSRAYAQEARGGRPHPCRSAWAGVTRGCRCLPPKPTAATPEPKIQRHGGSMSVAARWLSAATRAPGSAGTDKMQKHSPQPRVPRSCTSRTNGHGATHREEAGRALCVGTRQESLLWGRNDRRPDPGQPRCPPAPGPWLSLTFFTPPTGTRRGSGGGVGPAPHRKLWARAGWARALPPPRAGSAPRLEGPQLRPVPGPTCTSRGELTSGTPFNPFQRWPDTGRGGSLLSALSEVRQLVG